jgi:phosphate transport system protein
MASALLRKALDAFARLDTTAAVAILKEDNLIDQEFDGFCSKVDHLHDGRSPHDLA